MKRYDLLVNNLINKRQFAIQFFSLIVSGLIGLIFLPVSVKTIILFAAGVYFAFTLLTNYLIIDNIGMIQTILLVFICIFLGYALNRMTQLPPQLRDKTIK